MKKKVLIFGLMISVLLSGCIHQGKVNIKKKPSGTIQETKKNEQELEETKKEIIKEAKLSQISNGAYGTAAGLKLEPKTYISVIGRSKDGDYWKEVQHGVKAAGEDLNRLLGYKGEDKIKVVFNAPGKEDDVSDQVNILDEELARYADAVAISIVDASASQVQFDLALENGIPIIAYDSGTKYPNIAASCSTDNKKAGAEAGARMAEKLDGQGKIAVFVHDSSSTTAEDRELGFIEELSKNHPEISVEVVYHLDEMDKYRQAVSDYYKGDWDPENDIEPEAVEQAQVVRYIFDTNPELSGVFTTSQGTTEVVVEELRRMETKMPHIIGFDAGEKTGEYMESGEMDGFILQNPYGIGYSAVIACARTILGMGNEAFVDTGFVWVEREHYQDEKIQKLIY